MTGKHKRAGRKRDDNMAPLLTAAELAGDLEVGSRVIEYPTRDERIAVHYELDYDEDADSSYLGEFTDSMDEWTVDRRTGIAYGERIQSDQCPWCGHKTPSAPPDADGNERAWDDYDDGYTITCICGKRIGFDTYWGYWRAAIDDDEDVPGYRIIGTNLGRHGDRNSLRYFKLTENHTPPGRGCGHVSAEEQARVIAEHGSIEACDIKAALEDYDQVEQLNDNQWSYVTLTTTLYVSGVEVAFDSCGGYEWGLSKEADLYVGENAVSMRNLLLEDAHKHADRFTQLAEVLRAISAPVDTQQEVNHG